MELINKEDAVALIKAEMDKIRTHSLVDGTARINLRLAKNIIEDMPTIDIVRCNECEWLKVHNTKELYAECRKWHIRFYPFDEDTRTHGCSWGEREGE